MHECSCSTCMRTACTPHAAVSLAPSPRPPPLPPPPKPPTHRPRRQRHRPAAEHAQLHAPGPHARAAAAAAAPAGQHRALPNAAAWGSSWPQLAVLASRSYPTPAHARPVLGSAMHAPQTRKHTCRQADNEPVANAAVGKRRPRRPAGRKRRGCKVAARGGSADEETKLKRTVVTDAGDGWADADANARWQSDYNYKLVHAGGMAVITGSPPPAAATL